MSMKKQIELMIRIICIVVMVLCFAEILWFGSSQPQEIANHAIRRQVPIELPLGISYEDVDNYLLEREIPHGNDYPKKHDISAIFPYKSRFFLAGKLVNVVFKFSNNGKLISYRFGQQALAHG